MQSSPPKNTHPLGLVEYLAGSWADLPSDNIYMTRFTHIPVLLTRLKEVLPDLTGKTVVDATLGLGGHAEMLLTAVGKTGKVIGIDQDETALSLAKQRFGDRTDQFVAKHGNFRDIDQLVRGDGNEVVDGVLFDLGVSSLQLDDLSRGFSFKADVPLDMRMDVRQELTAADILNTYSEGELADLFWKLGEEPRSRQIAKRIVEARRQKPIATTGELIELVGGRAGRIHPATKVFQALRMATNDELGAIQEGLAKALKIVKSGGFVAVITFHCIEERLVKNLFRQWASEDLITIFNKKVLKPEYSEIRENPRSRSAKLRIVTKI